MDVASCVTDGELRNGCTRGGGLGATGGAPGGSCQPFPCSPESKCSLSTLQRVSSSCSTRANVWMGSAKRGDQTHFSDQIPCIAPLLTAPEL